MMPLPFATSTSLLAVFKFATLLKMFITFQILCKSSSFAYNYLDVGKQESTSGPISFPNSINKAGIISINKISSSTKFDTTNITSLLHKLLTPVAQKYQMWASVAYYDGNHPERSFQVAAGYTGHRSLQSSSWDSVRPASPSDLYIQGSNTKVLTAAAILQHVQSGRFNLSQRVSPIVNPVIWRMWREHIKLLSDSKENEQKQISDISKSGNTNNRISIDRQEQDELGGLQLEAHHSRSLQTFQTQSQTQHQQNQNFQKDYIENRDSNYQFPNSNSTTLESLFGPNASFLTIRDLLNMRWDLRDFDTGDMEKQAFLPQNRNKTQSPYELLKEWSYWQLANSSAFKQPVQRNRIGSQWALTKSPYCGITSVEYCSTNYVILGMVLLWVGQQRNESWNQPSWKDYDQMSAYPEWFREEMGWFKFDGQLQGPAQGSDSKSNYNYKTPNPNYNSTIGGLYQGQNLFKLQNYMHSYSFQQQRKNATNKTYQDIWVDTQNLTWAFWGFTASDMAATAASSAKLIHEYLSRDGRLIRDVSLQDEIYESLRIQCDTHTTEDETKWQSRIGTQTQGSSRSRRFLQHKNPLPSGTTNYPFVGLGVMNFTDLISVLQTPEFLNTSYHNWLGFGGETYGAQSTNIHFPNSKLNFTIGVQTNIEPSVSMWQNNDVLSVVLPVVKKWRDGRSWEEIENEYVWLQIQKKELDLELASTSQKNSATWGLKYQDWHWDWHQHNKNKNLKIQNITSYIQKLLDPIAKKYQQAISIAYYDGLNPKKSFEVAAGETGRSFHGNRRSNLLKQNTSNVKPASPSDLYIQGSITKVLTAAAILQYVQSGKLNLSQKVSPIVNPVISLWGRGAHSHGHPIPNGKSNTNTITDTKQNETKTNETLELLFGDNASFITVLDLLEMRSDIADFDNEALKHQAMKKGPQYQRAILGPMELLRNWSEQQKQDLGVQRDRIGSQWGQTQKTQSQSQVLRQVKLKTQTQNQQIQTQSTYTQQFLSATSSSSSSPYCGQVSYSSTNYVLLGIILMVLKARDDNQTKPVDINEWNQYDQMSWLPLWFQIELGWFVPLVSHGFKPDTDTNELIINKLGMAAGGQYWGQSIFELQPTMHGYSVPFVQGQNDFVESGQTQNDEQNQKPCQNLTQLEQDTQNVTGAFWGWTASNLAATAASSARLVQFYWSRDGNNSLIKDKNLQDLIYESLTVRCDDEDDSHIDSHIHSHSGEYKTLNNKNNITTHHPWVGLALFNFSHPSFKKDYPTSLYNEEIVNTPYHQAYGFDTGETYGFHGANLHFPGDNQSLLNFTISIQTNTDGHRNAESCLLDNKVVDEVLKEVLLSVKQWMGDGGGYYGGGGGKRQRQAGLTLKQQLPFEAGKRASQ